MKKIFALILVLCFALSFAACGSDKDGKNATSTDATSTDGTSTEGFSSKDPETIAELYEAGFSESQSSFSDAECRILFENDGVYVVVSADMDAAKYEEYSGFDSSDENYDSVIREFYNTLENVKLTDVTDRVPSDAELNALVGKTLGELEEAGFVQDSYSLGSSEAGFIYSNDVYSCSIKVAGYDPDVDADDLSPNDIKEFVVNSAVFESFSWSFLDGEF